MEAELTHRSGIKSRISIGLIVLLVYAVLFALDIFQHPPAVFLSWGNLFALIVYFTPTYSICLLLFRRFSKKDRDDRFVLSLLAGIPLGFLTGVSILKILSLFY